MEWNGVAWNGVEWNGTERNGVEWSGMGKPPPTMQQGHMAIKTQEHEDFKDTRTRERKGTWAHGHMGHSQTTQGHKDTRAQEHTDNHKHKHKHKHKHNNERE